ncbi:hypothetical protein Tco_1063020 [Tanacetum coccineum]
MVGIKEGLFPEELRPEGEISFAFPTPTAHWAARIMAGKEPPDRLTTWDVFLGSFNDLLTRMPSSWVLQLHHLGYILQFLNSIDQDSLNLLRCLNCDVAELKDMVPALIYRTERKQTPASARKSGFVDFEPDPRVPLILGQCFLKTSHALIDVYEGEITLRVGKEAITFNLDQTSRYTADYNHMTVNKIDVIDMAYDEYSQEVLGFSNVIASGNPTPYFEPIVSTASPNLTPFGDNDFLLFEEADSFFALEDDPTSYEVDPTYQDLEGDILLLEAILNSEPPP